MKAFLQLIHPITVSADTEKKVVAGDFSATNGAYIATSSTGNVVVPASNVCLVAELPSDTDLSQIDQGFPHVLVIQ